MTVTEPAETTLAVRAGELFAAFRDGDETRMADLVSLLTPILWHTVRSQNLDHSSAEDVLQTTWLALIRNADSINDPRAVLQWLIVSARREAWRVAKVGRRSDPKDFEADDLVAPPDWSPEVSTIRNASDEQLWAHVARLSARCRELLRVIAFADRPDYAAVAVAMGMPVGSIGPTRGRCLAKLRLQLAADTHWEG
jgi:RNA polymerase sigma factor (sigma-70 family)